MFWELLILQACAHLLADYNFQPERWCVRKEERVVSAAHFLHALVVFIFAWALSLSPGFWIAALGIAGLHLITDIVKSAAWIHIGNEWVHNYAFFIDQAVHAVIFTVVTALYSRAGDPRFLVVPELDGVAVAAAFIFCSKPANVLIKAILQAFQIEMPREDDEKERSLANAGKLIGITERYLSLLLILAGQYAAVGLIIAAKSILRFNTPSRNEYILVGTLLSFGIATALGLALTWMQSR